MKTTVKFLSKQIGGKLREKVYTDDALRAMENYAKYYHETEVKKLNIHGVMQAEGSDGVSEGEQLSNEGSAKSVSVELTEDDIKWLHQKPVDTDWIKGYDRV